MSIYYVHYELQNGFVHNWIAGGPQAIQVSGLERFTGEDIKLQIAHHYYEQESGITETPAEQGPITEGIFRVGDYEGVWRYFRCREDHFVDHTAFHSAPHYLRSWAYAELMSETPQEAVLLLSTYGPADIWVNGQHTHRQEHFTDRPRTVECKVELQKGANGILVRFEGVALGGECPLAMALQVREPASAQPISNMQVRLPTTIMQVARRQILERLFEAAYLDRDVCAGSDTLTLCWPEEKARPASELMARLQDTSGRIYSESRLYLMPKEERVKLASSFLTQAGPHRVTLMPGIKEYYEDQVRLRRQFDVWTLGPAAYSETPYGTYEERRQEALVYAARRTIPDIYTEIARMELGWWSKVKTDAIMQAIGRINNRHAESPRLLIGLLGMLYRFGDGPKFPESLRQPLEECILGFRYWHDEPSFDTMNYTAEGHSILFHACEILAGQRYPEHTFNNNGQSGQWHREKGERLALDWLHARGINGFAEWDSSSAFADILLALSHLVDLAENEQVWEMATVMLDKVLFTLALNSYKGVFGSTHGHTHITDVKGGMLEHTAGITRLMWGMGIWNHHLSGFVSLACMKDYELPPILPQIATEAEELWNRERHLATGAQGEVNKVTYRTADYMLCSAQDYRPGQRGYREHTWQATLGAGAVVFVTHPACSSENDAWAPNSWVGNAILPRVAQYKDVLIAIHNLPDDDWMGFTHAYFPTYAFDEYTLRDGWAFARKGDGYLALTASQGLELVRRGNSAYRELRSYGRHNVWLCHMGRAAQDGEFAAFQDKILALEVVFEELSVRCTTLRGDILSFGWEGPLLRNGEEHQLTGFNHYENLYCTAELPAAKMEIRSQDYLMRLDFGYRGGA